MDTQSRLVTGPGACLSGKADLKMQEIIEPTYNGLKLWSEKDSHWPAAPSANSLYVSHLCQPRNTVKEEKARFPVRGLGH